MKGISLTGKRNHLVLSGPNSGLCRCHPSRGSSISQCRLASLEPLPLCRRRCSLRAIWPTNSLASWNDDHALLPFPDDHRGRGLSGNAYRSCRLSRGAHDLPLLLRVQSRILATIHRLSCRDSAVPTSRKGNGHHTIHGRRCVLFQSVRQSSRILGYTMEVLSCLCGLLNLVLGDGIFPLPRDKGEISGGGFPNL